MTLSAIREASRGQARPVALLLALTVVATAWAYAPVVSHEPILYDDPSYVTENSHVLSGLSLESMRWSLSAFEASNWHPLTWWSHMLDVSLFGSRVGAHFAMSVALHIAATLLLYVALRRLTAAAWPSAVVACLWAVHPLQVESVAWLAERKSTLSTVFWFATLAWYRPLVEHPTLARRAALVLFAIAALAAKPMAVTLPFTLLLLDWWPLGRWRSGQRMRCILEKSPLYLLVAGTSVLTWEAQQNAGAISELGAVSVGARLARAAVGTVTMLAKVVVPSGLCIFHPVPAIPAPWALGAAGILFAVTLAAWSMRARYPCVLFGWLWFAGTIFPVSGLMGQGEQLWAERYAYVPMVGLLVGAVWAARDALRARPRLLPLVAASVIAVFAVLTVLTRWQVDTWADSYTVFSHALAVHPASHVAHRGLGKVFLSRGRPADALKEFEAGLALAPWDMKLRESTAGVYVVLGADAENVGRLDEAEADYRRANDVLPNNAIAHNDLALLLLRSGRFDEALVEVRAAVAADSQYARARAVLGHLLLMSGSPVEAAAELRIAVALDPRLAAAQLDLGASLVAMGDLGGARARYHALVDAASDPERTEAIRRLNELAVTAAAAP